MTKVSISPNPSSALLAAIPICSTSEKLTITPPAPPKSTSSRNRIRFEITLSPVPPSKKSLPAKPRKTSKKSLSGLPPIIMSSKAEPSTPSIFKIVSVPPRPSKAVCAAIVIPSTVASSLDRLTTTPLVEERNLTKSNASRSPITKLKSGPPSIRSSPAPPSMNSSPWPPNISSLPAPP